MLKIFDGIEKLDFRQLMDVYEEWNRDNGAALYPGLSNNLQILYAEQDFYCFLKEFFTVDNAKYYVWEHDGRYRAALRMEPYMDGWLLEALETSPSERRKGYATDLILSTIAIIDQNSNIKLYSHIKKENIASLTVHKNCGFSIIAPDAIFIDGSHHMDSYTLMFQHRSRNNDTESL